MIALSLGALSLSTLHAVGDQLQISTIQLQAAALGRAHGLSGDALARLDFIVAAVSENIVRHAGSGHVILRAVGAHTTGWVEVLALDKGPGINDMKRAMRDSASTPGIDASPGGLKGVKQFADDFDIYSQLGRGTAVVAHVGAGVASRDAESMIHASIGVVCVPLRGEVQCGDGWAIEIVDGCVTALLVDGLGHGPGAAEAAAAALAAFRDVVCDDPEDILAVMHTALRDTRGAALSVTVADQATRKAGFCGAGNVDGRIVTVDNTQHLSPQAGIVGHKMPRVQRTEVAWPLDGQLVMHSDGISSRWRTEDYPGLLARNPTLLAGVLFRDFARERDDATVLVIRDPRPVPPE